MSKIKVLIASLFVVSASSFAGNVVDEIKQSLDHNGIKLIEWYKKGDTEFAETNRNSFSAKVALNESKGIADIHASSLTFSYMGTMVCRQLTNLIPHEKSVPSWGDDYVRSDDEKIIDSVIYSESPVGKKNEAILNGWKIEFESKTVTDFHCSITKTDS
ncbi:hypothetical protein [Vibrio parahaemolyticus]|uniref:hypothetical protein n=1 Tax=Vibrio parahaemolyticus TaxID=670 RepID=UPI001D2749CA|nr:hypothetical protein [Vibrio parahaemolyticus]EHR5461934.1 hypothetical protein [Vibrio parahaemolyticus]EJB8542959.1 hypothetical protein [Vibrio parahaemolyticus]MDF5541550.1 hypothetical protein [Vibrio parahaemolyticus]